MLLLSCRAGGHVEGSSKDVTPMMMVYNTSHVPLCRHLIFASCSTRNVQGDPTWS